MLQDKIAIILQKNSYLHDSLEHIEMKRLGSRKKLECYLGLSKKSYFVLFYSNTSSRVLRGEFEKLEELASRVSSLKSVVLHEKVYLTGAPCCSKALQYAKNQGWKVIDVSL